MRKDFLKRRHKEGTIPKLREDIFNIDENIRFITVINSKGKLIQSQHKEGIKSLLGKKESVYSIKQITKFWKGNKELVKKFGDAKYAIIEYEKIKRIIISFGGNELLYITTDLVSDHNKIVSKIFSLYKADKAL